MRTYFCLIRLKCEHQKGLKSIVSYLITWEKTHSLHECRPKSLCLLFEVCDVTSIVTSKQLQNGCWIKVLNVYPGFRFVEMHQLGKMYLGTPQWKGNMNMLLQKWRKTWIICNVSNLKKLSRILILWQFITPLLIDSGFYHPNHIDISDISLKRTIKVKFLSI